MEFFWIRCVPKYDQKGYLCRNLLTQKSNREETIRVIANGGNAYNVCSLVFVSGVWPTYSFIVT